jgi:hypothetical protein
MYGLTLLFIFLLVIHRPLATPLMNCLELYNECVILGCTCLLIGFIETNSGSSARDTLGWLFVGLASSIIAATAGAILYELGSWVRKKWSAWKENKTAKKYDLGVFDAKDGCRLEDFEDRTREDEKIGEIFD